LLIGGTGHLKYKEGELAIEAGPFQYIGIGTIIMLVGVVMVWLKTFKTEAASSKSLTAKELEAVKAASGISISSLEKSGETFKVQVQLKKPPPTEYKIWLLRRYPGDGSFYPMREVPPALGKEIWPSQTLTIGKISHTIMVALASPYCHYLFERFEDAEKRHNDWMDRQKIPLTEKDRHLPNLDKRLFEVMDIVVCETREEAK
jgi:hypothetical protein